LPSVAIIVAGDGRSTTGLSSACTCVIVSIPFEQTQKSRRDDRCETVPDGDFA
jgi:hypothetical protein